MIREEKINKMIGEGCDTNLISDGYHTFGELYEHRIELFITLCRKLAETVTGKKIWRSKAHSDGSVIKGWFVLGIGTEKGEQITYHLPVSKWKAAEFAETLPTAPEYDGHSSEDVLQRLKNI